MEEVKRGGVKNQGIMGEWKLLKEGEKLISLRVTERDNKEKEEEGEMGG